MFRVPSGGRNCAENTSVFRPEYNILAENSFAWTILAKKQFDRDRPLPRPLIVCVRPPTGDAILEAGPPRGR